MKIGGIQKLTLLDYPGIIAATVFTPGCDLRCPFCHNSELVLDSSDTEYYENEVLDFLKARAGKIGGVAITGGEPLMQDDIAGFARTVKSFGLKVKLDTNGTYPERLKALIDEGLLDYIAMDLKNCRRGWARTTGLSENAAAALFEKTLVSMEYIKSSGIDYEFRTTVVRELHSLSDMEALGMLAKGSRRYFLQSFEDSGKILCSGYSAWDKETLLSMLEVVKKYVPAAELRGIY